MNKNIAEILKRIYRFDRPAWDTLKEGIDAEWQSYCESSCYPSPSEAISNFNKGKGAVWKELRDYVKTIELSDT